MKFVRNDMITHVKSKRNYMVLASPVDGVVIESTGKPGYLYQEFWIADGCHIWVRDAVEMEDGRFKLHRKTTHGASGRMPE